MNPADLMRMMMGASGPTRNPDDPDPNQSFYFNQIESKPDGALIDTLHESWFGDFDRLEMHHGYIQWLFPVFENAGMNFESEPLTKASAKAIRENEDASRRVLKSYKLMLNFYGLQLMDETTGNVAPDPTVYERGIDNLNYSGHNWLRISRIITSLGELGFHRYKAPFLEALRAEVEGGRLANAASSFHNFWLPLVEAEDSEGYAKKTLEDAADRVEGCLFQPGGALAAEATPSEAPPVGDATEAPPAAD